MLMVGYFRDDPNAVSVRDEHLEAHLAYLDEHADRIIAAGALRDHPDASPVGAIWIIDAPDRESAEELCKADPFWTHGLRHSISVFHWSRAFPGRVTTF